jgi:hypothetical protein
MRILIVKLSSLGDVIQTMAVVPDLRALFPQAQIDWVVEEAFAPLVAQVQGLARVLRAKGRGIQQIAARRHLGLQEGLGHGDGLGPAQGQQQARMLHRHVGPRGDLRPDVAGAAGQAPTLAPGLAGDGDEAEIADRRADRPRVALNHDNALADAGGRQGVCEADNAAADHRQIKNARSHPVPASTETAANRPSCDNLIP